MAGFGYIWYFWFLLLIPAVILLHIRQLLRKTIPVPSTLLWKQVSLDSGRNRFSSLLRDLISLILKIGVITASVCALAGFYTRNLSENGRVFILDNSLSTSRSTGEELTPYSENLSRIRNRMRENDLLFITSPGIRRVEPGELPSSPSRAECDLLQTVRSIMESNPGAECSVYTDYIPEEFNVPQGCSWYSTGKTVRNVGIRSILLLENGLYFTLDVSGTPPDEIAVRIFADGRELKTDTLQPLRNREYFYPVPRRTQYAELQITRGGGAFSGDDYRIAVRKNEERPVTLTGSTPGPDFTRFLRASERTYVRSGNISSEGINVVYGNVTSSAPGSFLFIKPSGEYRGIRFQSRKPVSGPLIKSRGAEVLADVRLTGKEIVTVTRRAEGNTITPLLTVGGEVAAGLSVSATSACVFLLFDPEENPLFTQTVIFPVFFQSLFTFLSGTEQEIPVFSSGEKFPLSGKTECFRMGKPVQLSARETYITEPGIYRQGDKLLFACDIPGKLQGLNGEPGKTGQDEKTDGVKKTELPDDSSNVLLIAAVLLFFVLVYTDRK